MKWTHQKPILNCLQERDSVLEVRPLLVISDRSLNAHFLKIASCFSFLDVLFYLSGDVNEYFWNFFLFVYFLFPQRFIFLFILAFILEAFLKCVGDLGCLLILKSEALKSWLEVFCTNPELVDCGLHYRVIWVLGAWNTDFSIFTNFLFSLNNLTGSREVISTLLSWRCKPEWQHSGNW